MLVHADKLRWLAWLRMKMLTRGFRRRPATLVFVIIGILVLLFGAGWLALGLFALLTSPDLLSTIGQTEMLYLFFTAVLLFWIALPLMSYSTNEGLDVTKLQLYPLTRLELMFSLLFSSLFDIWTVFLFVLFGTTIVAWWTHSLLLGLMTLLVLVVFYVTMVGISQLVLALLMRTLQSRRVRDLSILIIALFSSSCYFFNRFAFGAGNLLHFGDLLNNGGFSPYLQWLPSGVAASALRAASQGNWGSSFALLGLLLLISVLALYLWQIVLERSMSASETGASRKAKQRRAPTVPAFAAPTSAVAAPAAARPASSAVHAPAQAVPAVSVETGLLKSSLFEQIQAVVWKDLICFWRDPLLKTRIFQSLIYVVIFVVAPIFTSGSGKASGGTFVQYAPFTSAAVALFFMLTLSLNTLGIERKGLTALLLFPIDRRRLLWGKNMAVLLIGGTELLALMVLCIVLARQPGMVLPALVMGVAGMGVALGCGNMASVFFPRYQPEMGRRSLAGSGNQAPAGGCLNQLMSLVALITTVLLLAPVALGIGIPFFLNMQVIWLLSMPLSLVYGFVLYIVFTNLAARRLLVTEPEIISSMPLFPGSGRGAGR
ncbi:MAG TPA: hypothetical protein VF458_06065 [Ktedonobacteraceae bacterium]